MIGLWLRMASRFVVGVGHASMHGVAALAWLSALAWGSRASADRAAGRARMHILAAIAALVALAGERMDGEGDPAWKRGSSRGC